MRRDTVVYRVYPCVIVPLWHRVDLCGCCRQTCHFSPGLQARQEESAVTTACDIRMLNRLQMPSRGNWMPVRVSTSVDWQQRMPFALSDATIPEQARYVQVTFYTILIGSR
jgi:hypothetical protein